VVTARRGDLAAALAAAGLAASTLPVPLKHGVLAEAHGGDLVLTGATFASTITVTLPGAATAPGRVLIDHTEVRRLLGALLPQRTRRVDTQPVTLAATPHGADLVADAMRVPLRVGDAASYPAPLPVQPTAFRADRETFAGELRRVVCALDHGGTFPQFTGLHLAPVEGGVQVAAGDGARLALAHIPTLEMPRPMAGMLPGALIGDVAAHFTGGEVTVGAGDGLVSLTSGTITATVRPLDVAFTRYRHHVPDAPATATITRLALIGAVRKVRAITAAKRQPDRVELTLGSQVVTVAPLLSDGQATAPPMKVRKTVGLDGDGWMRLVLRARHLLQALDCIRGEAVDLHATAPDRAVILTEAGARPSDPRAYRHLLPPAPTAP